MNYRHAFHAGNFADVVKHAVVLHAIAHLQRKPKPAFVLDTHGGAGRYDLTGEEAQRSPEHRDGIGRLWGRADLPPLLAHLVDAVASVNRRGALAFYPGSPLLIAKALRREDRLVVVEKHPDDAAALAALLHHRGGVSVRDGDGWAALVSFVPPAERRGLVLVDPPFEARDEFARMSDTTTKAVRRWATGTYVFWYPVKPGNGADDFEAAALALPGCEALTVRLWLAPPAADGPLTACGLTILNPPYTLADALGAALPVFCRLSERAEAGFSIVNGADRR